MSGPVRRLTPAAAARHFPALFVCSGSTGFIAAAHGLPYAPPYAFLAWRSWRRDRDGRGRAGDVPRTFVSIAICVRRDLRARCGLGGVWVSLDRGMAAGTSAMPVGLQPTHRRDRAWRWMREHVSPKQWMDSLARYRASTRGAAQVDFGGNLTSLVGTIALVAISRYALSEEALRAHRPAQRLRGAVHRGV
jgi:hypothetical protein